MSNAGTTIRLPKVSKAEAIVELTLEKHALLTLVANLTVEKGKLQEEIEELEKKLASSVTVEYFSSAVKRMVREGKIPVPKGVLAFNLPVECICEPMDVDIKFGSIYARVAFECNGYTETVGFDFVPAPRVYTSYPEFHMGYKRQKFAIKKKPRTATIKPKAIPPDAP